MQEMESSSFIQSLFLSLKMTLFTHSLRRLINLMQSFEQHGHLSGYMIKMNKTQILSYNYNTPEGMKYPLNTLKSGHQGALGAPQQIRGIR